MKNRAYTLVEILVVVAVFSFIFGLTLSIIYYSNQSWRIGRLKLETQQEARKAMDFIALQLRESAPMWQVDGVNYEIEINAAGDAIRFYVPIFDISGEIIGLQEERIYCAGQDGKQLFRIAGAGGQIPLTDAVINNVASEKPFFQFLNGSRSEILVRIPVIINQDTFVLSSQISLRNNSVVINDVPVEEIAGEEGEF
ncbi:MAG: type II secretion system protein [Candidatus Omnitrophota bacterium]